MQKALFTLPQWPIKRPDEPGLVFSNWVRSCPTTQGLGLKQLSHLRGATGFGAEVAGETFTHALGRELTCTLSQEWRKAELTSTWKASIDSWLRKCLGCVYIMLFLFLSHKEMTGGGEEGGGKGGVIREQNSAPCVNPVPWSYSHGYHPPLPKLWAAELN